MPQFNAMVIRTKPNYYTMIGEKLRRLPWGDAGEQWLDVADGAFSGKTPRDEIEAGHGHIIEGIVDEMVAIYEAYEGLTALQDRFGHVPQLQGVWEAFDAAKDSYPWKT